MASAKQKAAARRNIKKAQAALRAKKRGHAKPKRRRSKARGKSRHTKKAKSAGSPPRRRRRRKAPKATRRVMQMKLPRARKRRATVRVTVRGKRRRRTRAFKAPRGARKVYVIAAERRRRRRRSRKHVAETPKRRRRRSRRRHVAMAPKRHRRRSGGRRRGALSNPLNGTELVLGGLFGLVGFGLGDLTDRLLATHALTLKTAATTTTPALYADTPPTSGNYQGLFNPTAICAPMDAYRWANAVLAPAVLFGAAHFVSNGTVRSSLQFAAFGYGLRTVGKGLIDGLAKLTTSTQMGQQLYAGEMRAQALAAANGNQQAPALGQLPAAGLGKPSCACGGGCNKCKGMGWPSMPQELPAGTPAAATPGAPSAPPPAAVVVTPPAGVLTQPRPTAAPAVPPPAPPGASTSGLTGAPKRPMYGWGDYNH